MAAIPVQEMAGRVGSEAVSDWIAVPQSMIDRFAAVTGDQQFIHVDPAAAAQTPLGGTIAHGFLILSLMPMLAAGTPDRLTAAGAAMGLNYGGNKVRFLQPVRAGARVRGRFRLLSFAERGSGQWQRTDEITIEIEGQEKPAMIAEWITLIVV